MCKGYNIWPSLFFLSYLAEIWPKLTELEVAGYPKTSPAGASWILLWTSPARKDHHVPQQSVLGNLLLVKISGLTCCWVPCKSQWAPHSAVPCMSWSLLGNMQMSCSISRCLSSRKLHDWVALKIISLHHSVHNTTLASIESVVSLGSAPGDTLGGWQHHYWPNFRKIFMYE